MSWLEDLAVFALTNAENAERVLEDISASVAEEGSVLSKAIGDSIKIGTFENLGLEARINGRAAGEVLDKLFSGEAKTFGDLSGIEAFSKITAEEEGELLRYIKSESYPQVFLKEDKVVSDATNKLAPDSLKNATEEDALSAADRQKVDECLSKLDEIRGGETKSLVGKTLVVGAGVTLTAGLLFEMARERNGCHVTYNKDGKPVTCKLQLSNCANPVFATVCDATITGGLRAPFYNLKNISATDRATVEKAVGSPIPNDDAALSAYISKNQKTIIKAWPGVDGPLAKLPFADCDAGKCLPCSSSVPVSSPQYLDIMETKATVHCITGSTPIDVLMDLAGDTASSVIAPIIDGATGGSGGSLQCGSYFKIFLVLFSIIIAVLIFFKLMK